MSAVAVERPPNDCRYEPSGRGHVESYFVRANDPNRPRAIWLKATIFAPIGSEPVAETWCIWFDGELRRTWAHRETRPLRDAQFPRGGDGITLLGECSFDFAAVGSARGSQTSGNGACRWDLTWTSESDVLGEPLSIFPHPRMVSGPFPRSKLLTPFPALRVNGLVECFGERIDLDGWNGMQGHNWGREHAWEYAWGNCFFEGSDGAPDAMMEGFTGRIRIAGRISPRMSALVVRRGAETFRFDRVFDFWRQKAAIHDFEWSLNLSGPTATAQLTMNAAGRPVACLGYRNPDGRLSYCFNSKLADTVLRVRPTRGPSFEYRSEYGGALEFLRNEPDARCPEVV